MRDVGYWSLTIVVCVLFGLARFACTVIDALSTACDTRVGRAAPRSQLFLHLTRSRTAGGADDRGRYSSLY